MENISEKEKALKHHKNKKSIITIVIVLLAAFLFGVYALHQSKSVIENNTNANLPLMTPPVHQYDLTPLHTYFVNITIPQINISVGQAIYATPTLYKGSLLVSTMGNETDLNNSRYDRTYGELIRINLSTGKIIWRTKFPNQIMSQPITVGDMIIVAMGNNYEVPPQYFNNHNGMYAVDFNTGKIIWNITTQITNMPTPAYYKGTIVEPNEGYVMLINASSGAIEKEMWLGAPDTLSAPTVVNGIAYFGTCEASVYGFNASNFEQKNVQTDCRFLALNITNGSIVWSTKFPYAGAGLNDVSPAYWNGEIITGYLFKSDYEDPVMVAMNATNGKILWEFNTENATNITRPNITPCIPYWYNQNTISPITVVDGIAYLDSNYNATLIAVNATTGKYLWAVYTGQTESNPNVFDGKYLIIVNDWGNMFIINSTNGRVINTICTHIPHLENEVVITRNSAILAGMNGDIVSYPLSRLLNGTTG